MKVHKLILALIFLSIIPSCAQKDVQEPSSEVKETPKIETVQESEAIVKDSTEEEPDENTVIEQITVKPDKEETAVTYPIPQKIKKYEPKAQEDSWFLIGGVTGERAYSVFVDPNTIVSKKGLVNSWSKLEFDETERDSDGLSYNQVQISSAVDCENRTYSYLDSRFYDGLGRLVENQSVPYNPQPVIQGTVSAKIADFVCGYESNRPK